jgi:transcriptional regulator with XRE-family HTH domain
MSFGKRLQEARKKRNFSQEYIAKELNTKAPVIGRYERDEMKPSIEVATKLSELLEVSLDYLVGKTDVELDKNTFQRILEVSRFSEEDRNHIFSVIDAFIAKRKIQSIL